MPRSPKLCQISRWVGGTPLLPRLWTITGLHDSSMHFQQAQDEQDLMALRKTGQSLVGHLLRQWAPASTATSRSAFLCQRDDDQSGPLRVRSVRSLQRCADLRARSGPVDLAEVQ